MGNPDKRRKRSKIKAKANRTNKNPSLNNHDINQLDVLELTEDIESFFKTLPPFTSECKAVPLIKRFIEAQGNTPSYDVINHVRELLALFAHWSDGLPLYYTSIEDLIIILGESPEFAIAFKQSEQNILGH